MYKYLYFFRFLVLSYELIFEFNSVSTKQRLFDSLPLNLKSSLTVLDTDLSQFSNLLKVECGSEMIQNPYQSLFRVYKNQKIQQKSLRFLSEVNGVKSTEVVEAESFWKEKSTGQNVKIAILDSGFSSQDKKYINVVECINFTNEPNCEDTTGHGTTVASIIASTHPDCPGLAQSSLLYSLKVFNASQESQTSWFLEAFSYVLQKKIKILNLSNGGINFMDEPFVSKISELVNNGVIIVSAAGNDGPGFGTLSNPGDQSEVIGVGGLDETGIRVSDFSSRGPTLWEISGGMGRFKPDIVTFSTNIKALFKGECISKTGTSIATPLVTGAIALLNPNNKSPGLIKMSLLKTADLLEKNSIFEQGAGKMNLTNADVYLNHGANDELLVFPAHFNNTLEYFFPYNLQPLYTNSPPLIINFTVTHPVMNIGELNVKEIKGRKSLTVYTEITNFNAFTATFALFLYAKESFDRESIKIKLESGKMTAEIIVDIKGGGVVKKDKRILWDLTHNAKFPESGTVIRDELEGSYLLDWRGDHPFTNHLELYKYLVHKDYVIDFLLSDFSCINGELYSTYLLIDPEQEFEDYHIKKIQYDLEKHEMSLIIFADWSDSKTLNEQLSYSNLKKGIPGCNTNTLNTLLTPYFVELSTSKSFSDTGRIGSNKISYLQGTEITRFPEGGVLITQVFQDPKIMKFRDVGIIGMAIGDNFKLGISGDSSCLDSMNVKYDCLWLVGAFLEYFKGNSVWDSYKLPYDYDIHVEEEHEDYEYIGPSISPSRMVNLVCDLHYKQEIDLFVAESHSISQKKIRVWAPLREIEPVDIVGVVYIATILIFALLFLILFYTRSRAKTGYKIRPLGI